MRVFWFCVVLLGSLGLALADYHKSYQESYGDSYDSKIDTDEEGPYDAFKRNSEETGCIVPRLGDSPLYGVDKISKQGTEKVTDDEARQAYGCAIRAMRQGYAQAENKNAKVYGDWSLFSTAPYLSKGHSKRYVSNYANKMAAAYYSKYEQSGSYPVGSALAKDSFAVTGEGRVVFGALSLMEKMPTGFNPKVGDWRFTLILPDGRVFGATGSDDAYTVKFCQGCHIKAGAKHDYVYYPTEDYRRK